MMRDSFGSPRVPLDPRQLPLGCTVCRQPSGHAPTCLTRVDLDVFRKAAPTQPISDEGENQ